ncbi:MAG: polysaccharide export protein [Campylobacterales bacterium]|nr:polysaccharide export protein [Campylobacterales bacterium]
MKITGMGIGWFFVLLLAGCSSKSDYQLFQTNTKTAGQRVVSDQMIEYRILPQDRLKISLYKNPEQVSAASSMDELGQNVNRDGILVDAAGYIALPLINQVRVAGLTQTQASERIARSYKKYLKNPTVYLEVMNKRVYVLGEVNKAGPVAVDKEKMTLLEALAFAGDMTDSAQRNSVVIITHNTANQMLLRTVDLTNFDSLRFADLMVKPNDIVYVQPNSWKQFKVISTDTTSIFETIGRIASPFVTIKYLTKN